MKIQTAQIYRKESNLRIKVLSDGADMGSSIERVPVTKVYPPDTTAAIFWLKNRQKDKWRDKQEHEITGKDGKPIQTQALVFETTMDL